ncbi:hypothetical protein LTR05_006417 [Lithohypha guttulata]|uniref:Protein Zds1 C-terminal domain-containing protein n=1 Tax=Lithohypha guttulata TaxID=1690604 RepID=A0AAN7SY03_9EURO|nr:hypothetical protein LTR05_006417 [Lithohypha guttulata]
MPWTYTITNVGALKQTSTGNREPASGASFAVRSRDRRHAPHLSISDDNHHVTETIGFLYGDDDERDPRRKSNAPSIARSSVYSDSSADGENITSSQTPASLRRPGLESIVSPGRNYEQVTVRPIPHPSRSYSFEKTNGQPLSPGMNAKDQSPSETAQSHFPLNDIDYESSPAAVAQELSNLQALRRMSMDVHAAGDPDLPTLNPAAIPNAPSPTASDDDASRLFWVPARLHPELAPTEFKTFLESKAEQIKRRSGDLSSLGSSPMSSRSASLSSNSSGLARKKSMLSREVNNSVGYQDGADILERKRSAGHKQQPSDPNLAELETLVARNLQVQRPQSPDEDVDFILPSVPSSSLKRSTKTKYQRTGGGVKARGERQRPLKRVPTGDETTSSDVTTSTSGLTSFAPSIVSSHPSNLADTLSFSSSKSTSNAQNFSRPAARSPSPPQESTQASITSNTFDTILAGPNSADRYSTQSAPDGRTQRRHIIQPERYSIPEIIETPPTEQQVPPRTSSDQAPISQPRHPERTSSRDNSIRPVGAGRQPMPRNLGSSGLPTKVSKVEIPPLSDPKQSLEQPSPLPGQDTNTSNLSFIPTLTVDRQSHEQQKTKKSGWGWLLGKDEEKEKGKSRPGKNAQSHDNTRLDVLQTSIDGNPRRRETIELDRDSLKLEEERRKESQRKTSSTEKREKESFISSLFGGKKSKAEKEAKKSPRLSPEPPYRELKADIDYSWTRFSILEERAIYRMAHIKLANPRRPLYSQVLLSNFMYSYLAKVQQMHPQMNLPTNAKQQKKQKEQPAQQSDEFSTYQRYQQQQHEQQQEPQNSQQQPMAYEGQYANSQEPSSSRPSTRGSNRHAEGTYNSYTYNRPQQPAQQQYETDREQEMW